MDIKNLKDLITKNQKLLKHLDKKLEEIDLELSELSVQKSKILQRKQVLEIEVSSLEHQLAAFADPSLDDVNMKSLFL